jgi:hypothetical protein
VNALKTEFGVSKQPVMEALRGYRPNWVVDSDRPQPSDVGP